MTKHLVSDKADTSRVVAFVLVYGSLRTGGIETLIVRMAGFLTKRGHSVVVCCADGPLLAALPVGVELVTFSDTDELRSKFSEISHFFESVHEIVVVSFDPISAARALYVELALPKHTKSSHLSGVFHTRAHFMTGERRDRIALNHLVAMAVGYSSLFFMNEECRAGHAERWLADLSSSPIAILPINVVEDSWRPNGGSKLRIVSVGRLVDFKAYNLGAPPLIRALRECGLDVSWDIYGDGPLHEEISDEINRCDVAEWVQLRGELPYQDFPQAVANYDLFVGVGTAALEAAMLGLPTICGTDSQRTLCYGYLKDLPFGNVGELQQQPPTVEMSDLIEAFARSNLDSKRQISAACREAASKYGMDEFIAKLLAIHNDRPAKMPRVLRRSVALLYCLATESAPVRLLRQHMGKSA